MLFKATEVNAVPDYKIWVKFSDGVEGEVDLSYLVGKGIFKKWENRRFFEKVHIGQRGDIIWDDTIDLCPDAIYLKVTGKSPEELFPSLKMEKADA